MNAARTIARLGLQEALRRRVFLIVARAHRRLPRPLRARHLAGVPGGRRRAASVAFRGVEPDVVAGATLLGLNMFGTLFLGTILAVFLTLGAVRGDAERGLLQPLLVRPGAAPDAAARRASPPPRSCAAPT